MLKRITLSVLCVLSCLALLYRIFIGDNRNTPQVRPFATVLLRENEFEKKNGHYFFRKARVDSISFQDIRSQIAKKISHNPSIPGRFAPVKNNPLRITLYSASYLKANDILICGGLSNSEVKVPGEQNIEPSKSSWIFRSPQDILRGPDLLFARQQHQSITLQDGRILIVGGKDKNSKFVSQIECYDPQKKIFSHLGQLVTGRTGCSLIQLNESDVLIAGGTTSLNESDAGLSLTSAVELFSLKSGRSQIVGQLHVARDSPDALSIGKNTAVIFGGVVEDRISDISCEEAELFERH